MRSGTEQNTVFFRRMGKRDNGFMRRFSLAFVITILFIACWYVVAPRLALGV